MALSTGCAPVVAARAAAAKRSPDSHRSSGAFLSDFVITPATSAGTSSGSGGGSE
jgi:hypothetical protein